MATIRGTNGRPVSGPLQGLTIVEMAALGPVPLAGQLLADLGANVVIIDRQSRTVNQAEINRRNKRSVALNLKNGEGLVAAKAIIAKADVLLEGFRPGVMEKLGIGPEPCLELNPSLIYGRMTGWGQDGPLAKVAGHDINYLALTGVLHAIGERGSPPPPPLNIAADYGGGAMFLVMGVLSAWIERSLSGVGQVVDVAMIEGVPAMMGLLYTLLSQQSWTEERADNMLDGGAPYYRCYETSDGKYLSVGAIEPQFFAELVKLSGLPESDCLIQNNKAHWPDMHARYEAHFRSRSRAEWVAIFEDSDACVAPVLTFAEARVHPHNVARNVFSNPDTCLQATPAPRFERTPLPPPRPAVAAGSDTVEVLAELGYSDSQLALLKASGALS
ncbi:carnitine dehydratase [Chromatiales bacterium (ex Bugula neritina AB1)]|nr:carnitine dehydratase [Chromatiales bacterium (ex Bugula neritina AB1)]